MIKTRNCTDPLPVNGGADCSSLGPRSMSQPCNTDKCPTKKVLPWQMVEDNSSDTGDIEKESKSENNCFEWSQWSGCSASCNGGRRARARVCNNTNAPSPMSENGSSLSYCSQAFEEEGCNTNICP